jgi:crossover junction endodeoxyribonuclease RusA
MTEIVLPWPPRELSPNARVHWARRAKAARAYREACYWLCKQAGIVAPKDGRIALDVRFYPPSRRRRDDDNAIGSFKAGRDGIADALGVDDSRFDCNYVLVDEVGGMVKVRLA